MFQFTHDPPSLPIYSAGGLQTSLWRGCPIRILRAHRLHAAPPERFAGLRVLLRSSAPRHPPRTLSSLCSMILAGSLVGWLECVFARSRDEAARPCSLVARSLACVMHVVCFWLVSVDVSGDTALRSAKPLQAPHDDSRYHALLCFSLALGKIEVIMLLQL